MGPLPSCIPGRKESILWDHRNKTRETPRCRVDFSEAFISLLTQAAVGNCSPSCPLLQKHHSPPITTIHIWLVSAHLSEPTFQDLHHWDIHLFGTPLKRIKNNDNNNKAIYKVTLGGIMQKPDDFKTTWQIRFARFIGRVLTASLPVQHSAKLGCSQLGQ